MFYHIPKFLIYLFMACRKILLQCIETAIFVLLSTTIHLYIFSVAEIVLKLFQKTLATLTMLENIRELQ